MASKRTSERAEINADFHVHSNLILPGQHRRPTEATGEAESLAGKLHQRDFGSRVSHDKPPTDLIDESRKRRRKEAKKAKQKIAHGGPSSVLSSESFSGRYRPSSQNTLAAFQELLGVVRKLFPDAETGMVHEAADEILTTLKNQAMKEQDKKGNIGGLLGRRELSEEIFNELQRCGRRISDYDTEADTGTGEDGIEEGVAVTFEDSDEEDEGGYGTVAHDALSDDDDDEGVEAETGEVLAAAGSLVEGEDDATESLHPSDIDAYWLQRKLSELLEDHVKSQTLAEKFLEALASDLDDVAVESSLFLDSQEYFPVMSKGITDFIRLVRVNRVMVAYCVRIAGAQTEDERAVLEHELSAKPHGLEILEARRKGKAVVGQDQERLRELRQFRQSNVQAGDAAQGPTRATLDLDELSFVEGSRLTNAKTIQLPPNTLTLSKKGYDEIHIPAPKPPQIDEPLVPLSSLPEWARKAFPGVSNLNRVQSTVYQQAFNSVENLLICAPTGSGKTNVAMLTILGTLKKHMDAEGNIDKDAFKIVYIAPMKSLVAEMVGNLGKRLEPYGISVKELTGDQQLTKAQIQETQIIITTPEKWDIVTCKSGDRTYTQLVQLVIIDEVHLLHDSRGPVLEAIVARIHRQVETSQAMVRLVGLSATLPNYHDVATFLRVNESGLFHFPNSYRPVPLQQVYIGVTEKGAIKRYNLMNEITYEKVLEHAGKDQVLVFVHSRKETAKAAKAIRDMALENDTMGRFQVSDASRAILQEECEENVKNEDLKDLLPYGFGCHHAGMCRSDRQLVEDLFARGHCQVLVSTATLAWGVNLPAHTVIIKGTQVYSPEKSAWVELSHLDVMQMLGRAGRPQYDQFGEGIIITSRKELQYYLFVMNEALPVESQMISRLPDHMNAEVVLGNVASIQEAADWLAYTYLYVRMLQEPRIYGIPGEQKESDPTLEQRRNDLAHTAATILDKAGLVKYERRSGTLQPTELGRIASHYYITHTSMTTYAEHLRSNMSDIDLFRLFALSHEFKDMSIRQEERQELERWLSKVPIPVKESADDPMAKVNCLLQAYISNLPLEGYAIVSDMVYITQSAGRLMRALFEIVLKRRWSSLARRMLDLCKMVNHRMWASQTPLRQFKNIPKDVLARVERKDIEWDRYFDYSPHELGELVRNQKIGKILHRFVHQIPRVQLEAHVQPITRALLRVDLVITPDFQWDDQLHGISEPFWIFVEDVDGDTLLHHEYFVLKRSLGQEEQHISFTVPIYEPLPPQYYLRVVSDRWLASETTLPVSFANLILPSRYPPHTELLDLQPLPVQALDNPRFEALYRGQFRMFNPIQTQVFATMYRTDAPIFLGAPTGSGKTVCAELAMLRALDNKPEGYDKVRIVYVAPYDALLDERMAEWQPRFGEQLGCKIGKLTGETLPDLRVLAESNIVLATPDRWDILSRRWRQRRNIKRVSLFIVDELHLVGGDLGPKLEVITSRMRYITAQKEKAGQSATRIVALSCPIANAKDLGEWVGAGVHGLFNFHPNVRPVPLEIHVQGFDIPFFQARMLAMSKPTFNAIKNHAQDKPAIVFAASPKQARMLAFDLLVYAAADDRPKMFLHTEHLLAAKAEADAGDSGMQLDTSDAATQRLLAESGELSSENLKGVTDRALVHTLQCGIGFLYTGQSPRERDAVTALYDRGVIQVLVCEHSLCWGLRQAAHLVVVTGTSSYEGREHRYRDYSITDLLQMMGRANRPTLDVCGKCVILCYGPKKEYYMKFLYEPFPVESHIDHFLSNALNAEIVTGVITNLQDAVDYLTWTFLYRRLTQNPNYYNMQGVSNRHLSDHLSRLVESTMDDLQQSRCISIDDDGELSALNLGMIAAYYYIHYTTIELFANSLKPRTKTKGLLEIMCAASEFEELPIRHREEATLRKLAMHLPLPIDDPKYHSPHVKAQILLQAHFSRLALSADLKRDTSTVLSHTVRLIQAMVDVLSSSGWLTPALACMELAQMVTQGLWDRNDSVLKQLPHVTDEIAKRFMDEGVESIFDFVSMDDARRLELLQLEPEQVQEIAAVCNGYPNIDVEYRLEGTPRPGQTMRVHVDLERENDLPEHVHAPRFPKTKEEGWWVVLGDTQRGTLLAIKRLNIQQQGKVDLEFQAPDAGTYDYTLYLMCDAYLGCDQEYELQLTVAEE